MTKKLGILLIIISFIPWIFILGVPWLDIDVGIKAIIVTVFIVLGEVLFWVGAVLAGRDIVKKYIRWIKQTREPRRK
ncbi:transporter suffix domain-containing protein [Clostridium beijerinckii]|uniref:transporter suffix domain-containing protein n=1 Tax=Clostridium beijerinckii TaxID=1520 RepID=UPI000562A640|nr:transporter suffix domain-containing protein [Clostridium beijerinckii]